MGISFLPVVQRKMVKSLEHKFSTAISNMIEGSIVPLDDYSIMNETWVTEQEPASLVQWVATPFEIVRKMLELADVTSKDIIYDLGCGDARMLIMAVKEFGAQQAVGYEIRKDLCDSSRQEIQHQNLQSRITIISGNLLDAGLSEAAVIVLYLSPKANERLRPKLEREAKAGTRVVSYDFPIDSWCTDSKVRLEKYPSSERSHTKSIYIYVVPQAFESSTCSALECSFAAGKKTNAVMTITTILRPIANHKNQGKPRFEGFPLACFLVL